MPDFTFTAPNGKEITVTGPEGSTQEQAFEKAKQAFGDTKNKTTTLEQVGTGLMDPIEGGAQLLEHLTPAPIARGINKANNWLAEKTGLVAPIPEGGMDEHARQREAAIAKERGGDAGNVDWSRMAGNMLNPINYFGGGLVGGAGKVANIARAAAGGATAGALSPVTSDKFATAKANQAWEGATIGTIFGLGGAAVSKGVEKVGEFIASKYPEAIENNAVKAILQRINQGSKYGGPTATDMLDLMSQSKKPLALADVGSSPVRGLAGKVARAPGESNQIADKFFKDRDTGAPARISADIAQRVHSGATAREATDALVQSRSAASTPLYDDVHALQGVWNPRLQTFLDHPAIKAGMSRGWEIESILSVAEDRPLSTTQMGVDLDMLGNIKILDKPNMRLLDMAKRGLDAMISDERDEISGRLSAKGVALDKMRKAYVETLDGLDKSGTYKKARETWGGYSKAMDAVKLGRAAFGQSEEDNAAIIKDMSPSEREFARIGLADILREKVGKTGFKGDEAKSLFKSPWMQQAIRPFFQSRAEAEAFIDAVTAEKEMFETGNEVFGGSKSAQRLGEDASSAMPTADIAKAGYQALTGHIGKALHTTWGILQDLGVDPRTEKQINSKIAEILFSDNLPKDSPIYKKLIGQMGLKNKLDPKFEQASDASSALWTGGGIAGATHENPNPAEVTPQ